MPGDQGRVLPPHEHFAIGLSGDPREKFPPVGRQTTPGKGIRLTDDGKISSDVVIPVGTLSGIIAVANLPSLSTYGGAINVSATPTDLAWVWGSATHVLVFANAGGGTLRAIAAPTAGAGTRLTIWNHMSGAAFTVVDNASGGSIYTRGAANFVLALRECIEIMWDGSNWVEVSRDVAPPVATRTMTGSIDGTGGVTILAGTGFTAAKNSTGNYTVTFTVAFPAAPLCLVVVRNNQPVANTVTTVTTGAFTVQFSVASTGVAQDQDFDFFVQAMA